MKVCVDVGNTTIRIGFYNEIIFDRCVIKTDLKKSIDEYVSTLHSILNNKNIDASLVEYVIYGSVVPSIDTDFKEILNRLFVKAQLISIYPGIKTGLQMKVDNPYEVGNDLVADLVGAKNKYEAPCLIVDLGTATKLLLLDKNGLFVSCLIIPGIDISKESLTSKTELLPNVSLENPKKLIECKNTVDAIRSGIVYSQAEMINGLINRYENELGYKCKHIITGGAANYVKNYINDAIFDEDLVLDGLFIILNKNI